MTAIKNGYRPKPGEPPEAEIIGVAETRRGKSCLVLQVKIEGRDQELALTFDALQGYGLSGPAAVEELRRIREAVEALASREHRQNR